MNRLLTNFSLKILLRIMAKLAAKAIRIRQLKAIANEWVVTDQCKPPPAASFLIEQIGKGLKRLINEKRSIFVKPKRYTRAPTPSPNPQPTIEQRARHQPIMLDPPPTIPSVILNDRIGSQVEGRHSGLVDSDSDSSETPDAMVVDIVLVKDAQNNLVGAKAKIGQKERDAILVETTTGQEAQEPTYEILDSDDEILENFTQFFGTPMEQESQAMNDTQGDGLNDTTTSDVFETISEWAEE